MIMLTLMLTSKGVAGVSRAALVILLATASSTGLPTEPVFLLLGVDQLLDMGRTAVNVLGNCLAAVVMAKWEGDFAPRHLPRWWQTRYSRTTSGHALHAAQNISARSQETADATEFRQRSHEVSRIEAFSDVVFGFSLTLLVVSLEVPRTFTDLLADMRGFLPFAVCFAIFALVWWLHHNFFRRYGLDDGITATLNFVLLFVMLFYTYPLKFLFTGMFSEMT